MLSNLKVSEELARETRAAVARLGLTWAEIKDRGGPSPATMTKLVKGEPVGLSLLTCRRLDAAFGWEAGTARRLAAQAESPVSLHGVGPSTGRLVYRVTHESGVTADAIPDDSANLELLVEQMREMVATGATLLRQLEDVYGKIDQAP